MHRREAALSAQLPMSSLLPALRATYDDGEWVALLFDEVDGRLPRLPWDDAELRRVVTAIEELHEVMTPCPVAHVPTMARRLEAEMSGWRTIAAGLGTDVALDDWARRHVGRLAALESQWAAAAGGDTLLHGDIRVDNLLVTRDNVVFVDWANAGRGAPMFDIVAWAPTVVMQGGPAPEQLLAACPATARAEPDAVDAVVAAIAGYFVFQAAQPPPPGLPTVRAFQAAQGDVTLAWLRERTGWR
jgi:aminoglycoside phosphotransferase (APT) family kinase protein